MFIYIKNEYKDGLTKTGIININDLISIDCEDSGDNFYLSIKTNKIQTTLYYPCKRARNKHLELIFKGVKGQVPIIKIAYKEA
jgi:hypothetical protein